MIKILIVDDEQPILKVLSWRLNMLGYQVSSALDGLQALEQIENQPPQLIISDIRMPKMDGLTLLNTLQQTPYRDIPFILMSGHGDPDMSNEAPKLGAIAYLPKPVVFDELHALIESLNI